MKDKIINSIRSGIPAIHIKTREYHRLDDTLSQVLKSLNEITACKEWEIREWNFGNGWVDFNNKSQKNSNEGKEIDLFQDISQLDDLDLDCCLIVIKNIKLALSRHDQGHAIARLQQFLLKAQKYHNGKACFILVAEEKFIPLEIESLVSYLELPPLSSIEIKKIIGEFCTKNETSMQHEIKSNLFNILSGMSEEAIKRVLMNAFMRFKELDENILAIARHEKESSIAKNGILEMIPLKEGVSDIGGLDNLKSWLRRKQKILSSLQEAKKIGITSPKGVLLAGMPGCGKSLAAKAAANLFQLPLVRLDIGSVLGKYVGESEENFKQALLLAEHSSPCILWVDELEKAFSGIGSNSGGSEVTTRLFGYFLTWLQEKPSTVFVIATVNDISVLPPELLRKGRFDEVFYVDFPNKYERKLILDIFLKKVDFNHISQDIDLKYLAEKTDGYSGSDLQSLVNEALESSFIQGVSLSQAHLLSSKEQLTPLKETLKDSIKIYEDIFDRYKLKIASVPVKELDNLLKNSKSSDTKIREKVAIDENCPPDILKELYHDSSQTVRLGVLKNPNCNEGILIDAISSSLNGQWVKGVEWQDINKQQSVIEFESALQNFNMPTDKVIYLYNNKKINNKLMLTIINKHSNFSGFSSVCKRTKLTANEAGVVKCVNITEGSYLAKGDAIYVIGRENKEDKEIGASKDCLIREVLVVDGQELQNNTLLFRLLQLK